MSRPRPWGDYALRVLACALLFGSGFSLLSASTFALRMRDDVPAFLPGLTGVQSLAVVVSLALSLLPLLAGRRFLGALLVSGFLLSGIGAYWWTEIPWDELVTESDFVVHKQPDMWRYVQVASPAIVAVFYVAASRASRLRADYLARGVERDEVTTAACASFLAGMGSLVASGALAGALWWMLASGILTRPDAPVPRGAPAVLLAACLAAVAGLLVSGRVRPAPVPLRRPSTTAAGRAAPARTRARRSPS